MTELGNFTTQVKKVSGDGLTLALLDEMIDSLKANAFMPTFTPNWHLDEVTEPLDKDKWRRLRKYQRRATWGLLHKKTQRRCV